MDYPGSVNHSDSATNAPLDPSSCLPDGADVLRSPAAQSFRPMHSLQERARVTRTSRPAPLESNESIMSPQLLHNYLRSAQPLSATNEWNAVPQERLHRSLLTQHLTQQTMLPPRVTSAPWGLPVVSPINYWSANTLPPMTTRPPFHPSPPLDHAAIPSFGEVADFFSATIPNQTFPPSSNFLPIPYPPAHGDASFNPFTDRRVSPYSSPFSSPAHSPLRSPSVLSPANRSAASSPAPSPLYSPSILSPANCSAASSPTPSRSQSLTRDLCDVQIEGEAWGQGEGGRRVGPALDNTSGPNTTPPRLLGTPDGALLTLAALDRLTPHALVALGMEMVGPDIMNSLTLLQLYSLVQASIKAQAHALQGAASTLAEEALARGPSPSDTARMPKKGDKGRPPLPLNPRTEAAAVEAETSSNHSLSELGTRGGQREAAPLPPCALAFPFFSSVRIGDPGGAEGGEELLGGSLDLSAVEPDWDPLQSLPSAPSFNVMDLLNLDGVPEAAPAPPPLHSNPSIDLLPHPPPSDSTLSSLTSVSVWGRSLGEGRELSHSPEGGRDLFTWEGGGGGGGGADRTQMRSDAEAAAQKGGGVGGGEGEKGDGSGAPTQSTQAWPAVQQGEGSTGEGGEGEEGEKGERRSRTPKRQREEAGSGRGSETSQVQSVQSAGEGRASRGKSPNSCPGMGVEMPWLGGAQPDGQLSQCNHLQRLLTQFYDKAEMDLLDARSPMGGEEQHATVVSDVLSSGNAMAEEVQKYILSLESELNVGPSPLSSSGHGRSAEC